MPLTGDTFKEHPTSPLSAERPKTTGTRPKTGTGTGTGNRDVPQMPGGLPPTPGASEGEDS